MMCDDMIILIDERGMGGTWPMHQRYVSVWCGAYWQNDTGA